MRRNSLFGITALFIIGALPALAGTIYVNDGLAVYDYTTAGTRSTFSNTPGTTAIGMAFNSSGTLYAAARDSNAVLKYTPAGVESTFFSVSSPYGLAVDSAGNVYTGANFGSSIIKITPGGSSSTFATGTGVDSLAFDASGNLFEADSSGKIYEYAPDGTRTVFASSVPNSTFGLTFDSSGDLYASNWNGQILEFTPGGTQSVFATYNATFDLITGLTYDSATGNLYAIEVANGVSSCCNQQVWAFSPAGVQSTFATGLYNPFGIADLQNSTPAVPEPGTMALVIGGIACVGIRARRRHSRHTARRSDPA